MKLDNWRELDYNNIKMHVSKVKDDMLDQLEKETRAVKLMIEESLGSHNAITLEEASELSLDREG